MSPPTCHILFRKLLTLDIIIEPMKNSSSYVNISQKTY